MDIIKQLIEWPVKQDNHRIVLTGTTIMKLRRCRCGECPEFKHQGRVYGHGDCPTVWWVECSCGMATKDLAEGYNGTADECKADAAAIWERGMTGS